MQCITVFENFSHVKMSQNDIQYQNDIQSFCSFVFC